MSTSPTPFPDDGSDWSSHVETDPEKRSVANRQLQSWRPLLAARRDELFMQEQLVLIEDYANTRG